jgi:hypothetical protein
VAAGHGDIVDGAVHGQGPDIAAGEEEGMDYIGIRRQAKPLGTDGKGCGVFQAG